MTSRRRRLLFGTALLSALLGGSSSAEPWVDPDAGQPPGTTVTYSVEPVAKTGPDLAVFTSRQLATLEMLNRADANRLARQEKLVIPATWHNDDLAYSPFPLDYPAVREHPTFLVVDQPAQAFAAYEHGRLVRWGPVSSGREAHPTPDGLFHLTWRSRGRHSTVNPNWYMPWYFNFHNTRGLALHQFTLPGYPASHACIRLREQDAKWLYEWGETWTINQAGTEVLDRGTPLLIVGQYAFGDPPPWRSLDVLARGIALPPAPMSQSR